MELTQEQIKEIEDNTVFSVEDYGDDYYFSYYTDAGEDFGFTADKNDLIRDIQNYADNFDAEEHAVTWYGANRGEPQSIRRLLEDADDIKEQLFNLSQFVTKYE